MTMVASGLVPDGC